MPPPQSPDPDRAPIFIVGSGRSGTSLLRAMLNAHPRIHLLQESAFHTWTEMPGRWVDGARRLEFYYRSFSFAWLGLDPEELRAIFPAPVPREELPQVYRAIMRRVAERHGKPALRGQEPHEHCLPGSDLRGISRRARGAHGARSARHAGLRKLAPFLDRILTIRMEDLMADPRGTMAEVLEFVDEPWDDAAERAPDAAIRLPPADLPAEPGARQMARAVAADVARGAAYLWRAARMVRRLFGRPPADAAEAQRLLFGLNPAVREHHPDWSLPDPPALPGAGR